MQKNSIAKVDLTKYEPIKYKIIGCAIEVHNIMGLGFQEKIYQRALELEFEKANLFFEREKTMNVKYKEIFVGERRVDFLVEQKILVELKAASALDDNMLTQTINYLEAFNLEVALLSNFGEKKLNCKRLLHTPRA